MKNRPLMRGPTQTAAPGMGAAVRMRVGAAPAGRGGHEKTATTPGGWTGHREHRGVIVRPTPHRPTRPGRQTGGGGFTGGAAGTELGRAHPRAT